MNRSDKYYEHNSKKSRIFRFCFICLFLLIIVFLSHFLTESFFNKNQEKVEFGKKVVIILPNGKKVFTYENLIVEENGKLFYKGERNTIDLTGGNIIVEDWE